MADPMISEQTLGEDIQNPPAKRPCLDAAATLDAEDNAEEGSDFYNTPLNGGTPAYAPQSSTVDESSAGTTPQKPPPRIPGLTFFGEESNIPQSPLRAQVSTENDEDQKGQGDGDTSREIPHQSNVQMRDVSPERNGAEPKDKEGEHHLQEEPRSETIPMAVESSKDDVTTALDILADGIPATDAIPPTDDAPEEENGEPEWEVDSSPYESSSSSDTSSDSSDDSDEDESELLSPEEQARILMAAEGSDDEGDGKGAGRPIMSTHEKPEEIVPKPDITITPDMKIEMLGNVETIVENVVLIKANISGEYQVLEAGSVLCNVDLNVLGVVSETLGRVEQPLYTLRFPSEAAVKEAGIEKGVPIFYVVEHSTFVFTQPLKGLKGSDASNLYDEEPGEHEIEFSDDEAEAEYKRQLKQKKKQRRDMNVPPQYRREPHGPSGLRNTELNYDDDDAMDEGYTPLARPKNLHEMMGPQEAPLEEFQPYSNYSDRGSRGGRGRGRGRGRGYDRGGRGQHGRGRGHYQGYDGGRKPTHDHASSADTQHFQPPQHQPNPYQQQAAPSNGPYNPYQNQQQQQAPNSNANAFPPGSAPPQQFPFQQPFPQYPFLQPPPGSHINPAFFQNFQQQTQQQAQPQFSVQSPNNKAFGSSQTSNQTSTDAFAQAQAQLDLLRRLSQGQSGS